MDAHDDTRRPSTGRYLAAESLSNWSSTLSRVVTIDPSVSILDRDPSSNGCHDCHDRVSIQSQPIDTFLRAPDGFIASTHTSLSEIVYLTAYNNNDLSRERVEQVEFFGSFKLAE